MTLVGERSTTESEAFGPRPGEVFVRSVEQVHNASVHSPEGFLFTRKHLEVGDISTPEDRRRLYDDMEVADQLLKEHPEWTLPPKGVRFQDNPVFDHFYNRYPGQDSMKIWRDTLVPNATALYPLQRFEDAGRLFPNGEVDLYAIDIFKNHEDSVAIRSRGAIYKQVLLDRFMSAPRRSLKGLALGAGAGVPNIDATVTLRDTQQKNIAWRMFDTSYNSLEFAEQLALEAGIEKEDIVTKRADYKKAFLLESETVDIADMLGLMEYLSREDCVTAMHELYRIINPGGVLVVSNMLDSRSHLDFHKRGLQWPGVVPRSIDDLVDMVAEAGIDTNHLTVSTAQDEVYAVLEIRKP